MNSNGNDAASLVIPRSAFVALKRSIDPHYSDSTRLEILRTDFDAFWAEVMKADQERRDATEERR